MTPLVRLLKRWVEVLFGEWREGPEPPQRLREMVLLFAAAHPRATRREWLEFAAGHAGECYRTGYVRGYEATFRDDDEQPWRRVSPEQLADEIDPGWRQRQDDVVLDVVAASGEP